MSDASYDVVVVGMGGAGLCAALSYAETARQHNARRASPSSSAPRREKRGGATRYTTARIRIDDDNNLDPTFVDDVAATHRDADLDYLRTLERETPASIRFIEERGVELMHYPHRPRDRHPRRPGGEPERRRQGDRRDARRRARGHRGRRDPLRDRGGRPRHRRRAAPITGITARGRDGYLATLSAPAVILACGGWQNNKALMAQYLGPNAADMPLIAPGVAYNTGDGLRMATAVGGGVAGQFDMVHGEPYDRRTTYPDAVVLSYPYGILVNGARRSAFIDEGAGAAGPHVRGLLLRDLAQPGQRGVPHRRPVDGRRCRSTSCSTRRTRSPRPPTRSPASPGSSAWTLPRWRRRSPSSTPPARPAAVRPDDEGRQGDDRASRPPRRTGRSRSSAGPFVGYPLTMRRLLRVRRRAHRRAGARRLPLRRADPRPVRRGRDDRRLLPLLPRGDLGAPRTDVRPARRRARRPAAAHEVAAA